MVEIKKITVLTATLNAEKYISNLIESLQKQTDKDFEWVIADGASTDKTESIVKAVQNLRIRFLYAKDFGIYDALNRGIQAIDSGYYLVVGADDTLMPDAISQYRAAINHDDPDIITTAILQAGRVVPARQGLGWLYGLPGIAGSHAVGMMLKVDLHKRFGLYSRKFPIAADQYFIKQALAGGATIIRKSFIAGEFSNEGTSGTDPVGLLTDVFRVQVLTERPAFIQFLLFSMRLLKLYIFSLLKIKSSHFPHKNSSKL